MTNKSIYLDNASIVQPRKEIIDEVIKVLTYSWYNASSVNYETGMINRRIVQKLKMNIAKEINCSDDNIIICGSGSESNTLAIDGYLKKHNKSSFYTTTIEHDSILLNPKAKIDINVISNNGSIKINDLYQIKDSLVSIQFANNEIGVIQDIKTIVSILHKQNCIVHTDATQAFGHIPIDVVDLDVDMLSSSSQKISGVCGSGFLYIKNGIEIEPIIYGMQEKQLRGGTYNIPSIVAFNKAIELIDYKKNEYIQYIRDNLFMKLCNNFECKLNGLLKNRLPNNLNVRFVNCNFTGQQLVSLLGELGIYCSAGSACNSSTNQPSHVLKALGCTDNEANHSIRLTISEDTTLEDIDVFIDTCKLFIGKNINN